jgi:hypothetical protein
VKDMPADVRRRAKAINFGIIYGISAFGLAAQLNIDKSEAGAYIKKYFERFPGIRDYMDETREFCRDHGYVLTLFGRKCHYPDIKSSNPSIRSFNERAAINARLQGTAADIIRRAMIRIEPELEQAKLRAQMLLQVHDELIFEVPEAEVKDTITIVKSVMQDAPHPAISLHVPLQVDRLIANLKDWRGKTFATIRKTILAADPEIVEEWKWMGSPVWSRDGMIAVANAHKEKVKVTFSHGAKLADPDKLFNAGLGGNLWRAIDFFEGDKVNARALKNLVRAAIDYNQSKLKKNAGARAKLRKSKKK